MATKYVKSFMHVTESGLKGKVKGALFGLFRYTIPIVANARLHLFLNRNNLTILATYAILMININ